MNQLIIIFEHFEETPEKINFFRDRIRDFGKYAFVSKRACLIWTEQTPANVRDYLKAHLSAYDKLYVGTTSAPSAWLTSIGQDVTDYVKKNLT